MNLHTLPLEQRTRPAPAPQIARELVDDEALAPSTLTVQRRANEARREGRIVGLCATVLAHGLVLAAFLYVAPQVELPALEPLEVSILPDAPERPPEPLERKVEIKPPEMKEILPPLPEFEANTSTTAITMPPPPPPPAASPKTENAYYSRLLSHLNRYKRYPEAARLRRERGVVQVRFSIDRSGRVLSYSQVKSSGSSALDEEARQMVERANPFPPFPKELTRETLDLAVPVEFEVH